MKNNMFYRITLLINLIYFKLSNSSTCERENATDVKFFRIDEINVKHSLVEGLSLNIFCNVFSNENFTAYWLLPSGQRISGDANFDRITNVVVNNPTNCPQLYIFMLKIKPVYVQDAGIYRCQANGKTSETHISLNYSVTIREPNIVHLPKEVKFVDNYTPTNVSCSPQERPTKWVSNGKLLQNQFSSSCELKIRNESKIQCTSFANHKGYSKEITVIPISKETPAIPSNVEFKNFTSTSVVVAWRRQFSYLKYDFKYKRKSDDVWETKPCISNVTMLKDLNPIEKYEVQIRSCNTMLNKTLCSKYSNSIQFSIVPAPITNVSRNSEIFQWKPPATESSEIIKYKVRIRRNNVTKVEEVLKTHYTSEKFSHLKSYSFEVAPVSKFGIGEWSSALVFEFGSSQVTYETSVKPQSALSISVVHLSLFLVALIGFIVIFSLISTFMICNNGRKRKLDYHRTQTLEPSIYIDENRLLYSQSRCRMSSISSGYSRINKNTFVLMNYLHLSASLKRRLSSVLIDRCRLFLGNTLGEGEFGRVIRGNLHMADETIQEVAVKTIKEITSQKELEQFINEGILMKEFNNKNVLGLIGVCLEEEHMQKQVKPMVILPFMKHGDLQTYMINQRLNNQPSSKYMEIDFCLQIASGMEYLASRKFVHRDLAARNCMLDEDLIVKVADFGLSRNLYSDCLYRQGSNTKLPVKWLAIECLSDGIYTSQSDVWAFGVTMWEIFSRGQVPYPGVQNYDIFEFLLCGTRLRQPKGCPNEIFQLMCNCWQSSPSSRPKFAQIVTQLKMIKEHYLPTISADVQYENFTMQALPSVTYTVLTT